MLFRSKHSTGEDKVRHRVIAADTVQRWVEKLDDLKAEIAEILKEEKEEKQVGTLMKNHQKILIIW